MNVLTTFETLLISSLFFVLKNDLIRWLIVNIDHAIAQYFFSYFKFFLFVRMGLNHSFLEAYFYEDHAWKCIKARYLTWNLGYAVFFCSD